VSEAAAERFTLAHVEQRLWVASTPTGLATYDFDFARHFYCRHPHRLAEPVTAVGRMGAATNYDARFAALTAAGVRLIHTPSQYRRASLLPEWYPLLTGLTPRSRWFDGPPSASDVADEFGWPVFLKGERQTAKHRAATSICRDAEAFESAMAIWQRDPILRWQRVVARE
jgi:hypothetical protein